MGPPMFVRETFTTVPGRLGAARGDPDRKLKLPESDLALAVAVAATSIEPSSTATAATRAAISHPRRTWAAITGRLALPSGPRGEPGRSPDRSHPQRACGRECPRQTPAPTTAGAASAQRRRENSTGATGPPAR